MVSGWHVLSLLICVISFGGHCLADCELVLKEDLIFSWLLEPSGIQTVKVSGRYEASGEHEAIRFGGDR
jgi:hypothetical protein